MNYQIKTVWYTAGPKLSGASRVTVTIRVVRTGARKRYTGYSS